MWGFGHVLPLHDLDGLTSKAHNLVKGLVDLVFRGSLPLHLDTKKLAKKKKNIKHPTDLKKQAGEERPLTMCLDDL